MLRRACLFGQLRHAAESAKTVASLESSLFVTAKKIEKEKTPMRLAQHPSGKIAKFDQAIHMYSLNKKRLNSVTSLLRSPLMRDGEVVSPVTHPFDVNGVAQKVAKMQGKTVQEVKQEWRDIADFGTRFHAFVNETLTGEPVVTGEAWSEEDKRGDMEQRYQKAFVEYYELLKEFGYNLHVNGSEMIVFSPKTMLAGTIDCLLECPKGNEAEPRPHYLLVDWKTNKAKMRGQTVFPGSPETLNWPCEDIPAVKLADYQLQTNCYRHLLETEGYVDPEMPILMVVVQFFTAPNGEVEVDGIKVDRIDVAELIASFEAYNRSVVAKKKKENTKSVPKSPKKLPFG